MDSRAESALCPTASSPLGVCWGAIREGKESLGSTIEFIEVTLRPKIKGDAEVDVDAVAKVLNESFKLFVKGLSELELMLHNSHDPVDRTLLRTEIFESGTLEGSVQLIRSVDPSRPQTNTGLCFRTLSEGGLEAEPTTSDVHPDQDGCCEKKLESALGSFISENV